MDKPMLVFKRFGHQIHLMVQKEAKRCGIEFMGGPQGQVVRFLDNREKNQDLVLIKKIPSDFLTQDHIFYVKLEAVYVCVDFLYIFVVFKDAIKFFKSFKVIA